MIEIVKLQSLGAFLTDCEWNESGVYGQLGSYLLLIYLK